MTDALHEPGRIIENPAWRGQTRIFRDRRHAGEVLAGVLASVLPEYPLVLAIPAGGVPVGAAVAQRLQVPWDVAVVSKITLPWNTEAGYGAVAFDGTVRLNRILIERLALPDETVRSGIAATKAKVRRRCRRLRGSEPLPPLGGRGVIVVDDGLASGFTMQTAVAALRGVGAATLMVAVPTAHLDAARTVAAAVTSLVCPNLRETRPYAVAAAYRRWSDVSEEEVGCLLARPSGQGPGEHGDWR